MVKYLLLISCIGCSTQLTSQTTSAITYTTNVRDYGATGDGSTDDRASIQAALNAGVGGSVYVPNGLYSVGQNSSNFWCLMVPANTKLFGESQDAILIQQGGLGGSIRLLEIDTTQVTIDTLTLDGNKSSQSADEHRAGAFVTSSYTTFRNVRAQNFTGDGLYFYTGANKLTIVDSIATNNNRNGVTFGGAITGINVFRSTFITNAAQQFDSEPATPNTVNDLILSQSIIDVGTSGQYAITVAGSSLSSTNSNWRLEGNTINGTVEVIYAKDVSIYNNVITTPNIDAPIFVRSTADHVAISNNTISSNTSQALINVWATGPNDKPSNISIEHNTLVSTNPEYGVQIRGARSTSIIDNTITGPGISKAFTYGIYARSTLDIDSVIIQGNIITNAPGFGVAIVNSSSIKFVDVSNNTFTSTTSSMPVAISLGIIIETIRLNNVLTGNCTQIGNAPPGATWQAWGTGDRWVTF